MASTAVGAGSAATGEGSIAIGNATASNTDSIAVGTGAVSTGVGSIAIGQGAQAHGSVATGTNAYASNGGAAYGDQSEASGFRSTAVGYGATATHSNSAAFGNGATTTRDNQQVFGTASNTYTTPGITSGASKSAQAGPLEVVTTDASGNLASDGGAIFSALSELNGGVAIAMAMVNPDLVGNETFGIAGNISYWNENVALGFSAVGVVGRNLFGTGERLAVSGAVGVSLEEQSFGRRGSETTVGGRAGAQLTW